VSPWVTQQPEPLLGSRRSADTARAIPLLRHADQERADRGMNPRMAETGTAKPGPASNHHDDTTTAVPSWRPGNAPEVFQGARGHENGEQHERQCRHSSISVEEVLRSWQDERQCLDGSISVEELLRRWQDERQRRNGSISVEELLRREQDERQRNGSSRNGNISDALTPGRIPPSTSTRCARQDG
jgi:hypothetical protein